MLRNFHENALIAVKRKRNNVAPRALRRSPRHGFATEVVGRRIYAESGVNNAGGAGSLSDMATNGNYER
jgi:hypothetical protein